MTHCAHLILKAKWYDEIEAGEKKIEYHDNTAYWRKRLWSKTCIIFHRGYTDQTMMFLIHRGVIPDDPAKQIEIHLGERIR